MNYLGKKVVSDKGKVNGIPLKAITNTINRTLTSTERSNINEYAKEAEIRGEKRGEKRTKLLAIKNIMKNMGCTLEQALDALEISGKDRAAIIGKMKP